MALVLKNLRTFKIRYNKIILVLPFKQQDPLPINSIDIGNLLDGLKDIDDENRFRILTNHFQPESSFEFPSTFKHRCNRSLNLKWRNKYQCLSYSKALDAVLCIPCTLFTSQCKSKANAFTTGFKNWHKIDENASGHELSSNHVDNMAATELF